jgi:hypothetical protein
LFTFAVHLENGGIILDIKATIKEVFYSIAPITAFITLLQITFVKLPAETFISFIGGAILIFIGLTLFLLGVNVGFLPIGEKIGVSIVSKGKMWFALLAAFIIGFVVNVAEPDVQVLASQVNSVTEGTINKGAIIAIVSLGVGFFVALGILRILLKVPMKYVLLVGYAIVFLVALFTSPSFLGVAFDSGGVTTGPMTVPFILALGAGVASITSKDSAADSFGLVALASLGPIMAVLIMGVFYK